MGGVWYSVLMEADASRIGPARADELIEVLEAAGAAGPVVSYDARSIGARFSVLGTGSAGDMWSIARDAEELFVQAIDKVGIEVECVYRTEIVAHDVLARELEEPGETYVGVTEIAEMLGVSRQRVPQLRERPGFPAPVAELAAGPVWRLSSLQRFLAEWPRRPGRPPSSWDVLRQQGLGEGPALKRLTDRERRVLELVAQGHSSTETAAALGTSPAAVRSTIRRVLDKLDVGSRA